ncbi:MAG: phosphonate metabolism protein/1,5-bisphosphokinase (PRPP-forming) PhnN [Proteobacteria bacterium]|nr:phosphonate metabolism protein/1,5-bisphosphokinase (PRPP-forming) PhnN [Pseudomonadota bacterium]
MHNKEPHEAGKLIYLMGASGSGKDSLLHVVSGWQQAGQRVIAARRYITREIRPGCEVHTALSQQDFDFCERAGDFLFNWQAHGFQYGIGREVLSELACGKHVVMNGSRRYLVTAQDIYPGLIPVCLEVLPEVLEARLIARGRENAEEISARLQRAEEFSKIVPDNTIRISNNDQIEAAAEQLRGLLDI